MKYFNLNDLHVTRCHFITSCTSNLESLWDLIWLLQVLYPLHNELLNHVHQQSFEKPAILTLPDSASNLLFSCPTFPRQYFINISISIFSSSSLHILSYLCFWLGVRIPIKLFTGWPKRISQMYQKTSIKLIH